MSLFNLIYLTLFLILILVYVGAWIIEKRKESKSKKDFRKRQEQYKRMI